MLTPKTMRKESFSAPTAPHSQRDAPLTRSMRLKARLSGRDGHDLIPGRKDRFGQTILSSCTLPFDTPQEKAQIGQRAKAAHERLFHPRLGLLGAPQLFADKPSHMELHVTARILLDAYRSRDRRQRFLACQYLNKLPQLLEDPRLKGRFLPYLCRHAETAVNHVLQDRRNRTRLALRKALQGVSDLELILAYYFCPNTLAFRADYQMPLIEQALEERGFVEVRKGRSEQRLEDIRFHLAVETCRLHRMMMAEHRLPSGRPPIHGLLAGRSGPALLGRKHSRDNGDDPQQPGAPPRKRLTVKRRRRCDVQPAVSAPEVPGQQNPERSRLP